MNIADTIVLALRLFNNRERILKVLDETQALLAELRPDANLMTSGLPSTQQDEVKRMVEDLIHGRSH
jgi:hypothetical protein